MRPPINSALFGDTGPAGETLQEIFGPQRLAYLRHRTVLYPRIVTRANLHECLPELRDLEVIFCTWGMMELSEKHLEQLPNLKAVFYAAGSVKYFAAPLLKRGITLVSSSSANAVPVAEFTLSQILLANKGYFQNLRQYKAQENYLTAYRGPGNYDTTVSILGSGQIGRKLIELLHPFRLRVLLFDPFLSFKSAEQLGVEKVELEVAFACGEVVTNHLADVPETVHLLRGKHFQIMPRDATFINTGRGRTVHQEDLVHVLHDRPDLTALLDVTDPEPLPGSSPLRALRNVHITSHIAGSINRELGRVADYALEEFEAWLMGKPLRYAVTQEMLKSMA